MTPLLCNITLRKRWWVDAYLALAAVAFATVEPIADLDGTVRYWDGQAAFLAKHGFKVIVE